MKNSTISWTDHTFNPWIGCAKCSPGCAHCYAETMMGQRWKRAIWGPRGTRVRTSELSWRQPKRWNAEASENGTRYRVFSASLADVFENRDDVAVWRDDLHALIDQTPQLDWLLLTKRPEQAARYYETHPLPSNVWLGTSVEDRSRAAERIPVLASIPATVRFLSCEPLLEDLGSVPLHNIDWLIAGGESGNGFRPVEAQWLRNLRDQCAAADVPFFFKQWGGRTPKKSGNLLDGQVHDSVPSVTEMPS